MVNFWSELVGMDLIGARRLLYTESVHERANERASERVEKATLKIAINVVD